MVQLLYREELVRERKARLRGRRNILAPLHRDRRSPDRKGFGEGAETLVWQGFREIIVAAFRRHATFSSRIRSILKIFFTLSNLTVIRAIY